MDERARFPALPSRAGHYESFYIKACRPGGGQGIWIRHTVHKRPGAEPRASIWFVFFDRDAAGPRAAKVTVGASELSVPEGAWVRIEGSEIGPGQARGAIQTDALQASWELSFSGKAKPCHYLPADWLYEAPLPRTKFIAPYPDALFEGNLVLNETSIELASWPGMIGHNWGSEHAERWIWLEGTGFGGSPETYFEAGAAQIALGRWRTPWIPSGMLLLDGEPNRLGGLNQIRSTAIRESSTACEFTLPGKDILLRGKVSAPHKDYVGWIYADPKGPEHNTINCSVADLELRIERPALPPQKLSLAGGAAYELGMRETDHGVPIQPYSDG